MTKTTMRAGGSRCSRCPNQISQNDTCYHEPTGDSGKLYCADCGARLTNQTTRESLTVGTRIYNGGDMANAEHFGTITAVNESKWGVDIEITPDEDSDRLKPYRIPICMFSDEYKGHGGTRFVTEAAYNAWREQRIAMMRAHMPR